MSTKTSQLQIRVSPEQKLALKALAAAAGQSVSAYVMATVLPASNVEFGHRVHAIRSAADRRKAMVDFHQYLAELTQTDFAATVREVDLEGIPGILQNQLAGLVEDEARVRGVPSPPWVDQVDGPARPHFAWDLRSLRPHLLRLTPAAYKRRNLYIDTPVPIRPTQAHSHALAPLLDLSAGLESAGVLGEVCVTGGAVFLVAFRAKPESRRVRHLFHEQGVARGVVDSVAREHGLGPDWLDEAARVAVGPADTGSRFYEDSALRVYTARAGYVLALRVAALPYESSDVEESRARREIQELLRISEVTDEQDARALISPFFTARQLPDGLAALMVPETFA